MGTQRKAGAAIIVVNYGSSHLLRNNASLTSDERSTVVVVDNWTTPRERAEIQALAQERGWVLVEMADNAGFGAGVNAGAFRASELGADIFLVLNPDATIDAESRDLLVEEVQRSPSVLAAPTVLKPDGSVWSSGATLDLFDGRTRGPDSSPTPGYQLEQWLSGACFAIHRTLWERVGGFVDEYFLYWEDVDLSWRVRRAGGELAIVVGATAIHDEGGTHSDSRTERTKSGTYYYYNVRNRLVFAARNLSDEDFARWRRRSVRASLDILLEGGRRQFLQSTVALRAGVRGLRDGLTQSRQLRKQRADSHL